MFNETRYHITTKGNEKGKNDMGMIWYSKNIANFAIICSYFIKQNPPISDEFFYIDKKISIIIDVFCWQKCKKIFSTSTFLTC